jgi:splicing factor 3A subunit 1
LFVARNGIEFENKIKEREATNTRFNFLAPLDPYHAYYRAKIGEFETGVTPEGLPQPSASGDAAKAQLPQAVRDHIKKAEFVPKAPPKPMEFSADPTTLNAFDL